MRSELPLSKFYEAFLLQEGELPADEGIVVGVEVGCDEGPAVVAVQAESFDVVFSERWEILDPETGLTKFRYDLLWDFHLGQYLVLILDLVLLFLGFLLFLLLFLLFLLALLLLLLALLALRRLLLVALGSFLCLVLLLLGVFVLRFRLRGRRGRELGRKAVSRKLKLEFLGRSRDWHA